MADKGLYNLLIDLRANTAQLQQDMDKAVGILQRSGRLINNVAQGFAAGFAAAFGNQLIQQIGRLSGALVELADKGEEAGSIADTFRRIGGNADSIDGARKAVKGMVSEFDLMRVANQSIIRGLPDVNKNFASLADYAGRFANATGRDTLEVLEGLTTRIAMGSPQLAEFGIHVDKTASRSQKMAQAIEQAKEKLKGFDEVTDSVSNAHKSYSITIDDVLRKIGIGINNNAKLTGAYKDLDKAVRSIDWVSVGEGIGYVNGQIAGLASETIKALKPVAQFIADIKLATSLAQAGMLQMDRTALQARRALTNVPSPQEMAMGAVGYDVFGGKDKAKQREAAVSAIDEQIKAIDRQIQSKTLGALGMSIVEKLFDAPGSKKGNPNGKIDEVLFGNGNGNGGGGKLAKEIEQIQQRWKDFQNSIAKDSLKDKVEESINSLDTASFERFRGELTSQIKNAWLDANKADFLKIKKSPQEIEQMADELAKAQVDAYEEKMQDALIREQADRIKMSEEIAREEVENRRKLMDYYGFGEGNNVFSSLIDKLNSSFGASGPVSSAIQSLSQQLDTTGRYLYESATYLGSTMSASQAHSMGIQGPAMADGSFGSGAGFFSAAAPYLAGAQYVAGQIESFINADRADRGASDNRAWGGAIGGLFGQSGQQIGSLIGSLFGRGSQNPETQARHEFANWLEDRFREMGGFSVYDRNNQNPQRVTNFIEGRSNRFNDPSWADRLNSDSNGSVFKGLGLALKEIAGVAEDVGDQIAAMLFDNLEGNVNNARMLVRRLGLSYEEIEEKLVEIGLRGERTWLEIETGLQGASQAFKDGLVEVGAYGQAMQMALDSGGRGVEAVQSIRNIAVEAREAGLQNFEQLRAGLESAFDPATINAFFSALEQRGIRNLDDLAGASDRVAGGIVADMDAAGAAFKDTAATLEQSTSEANATLKESIQALRENTAAVLGNKHFAREEEEDSEVEMAAGGVIMGPQRALMGEAGPEAILPLTRKNGKLGVAFNGIEGGGSSMVFHIDARGAAPGVEHQIRRAMREVEGRVMDRIARTAHHRRGRVN